MQSLARLFLLLLCTLALAAHAADKSEDTILGVWLTDQKDSKIEVARHGASYAGKIVWLQEPQRDGKPVVDAKNEDASLRSRPILGIEILSGFAYASDSAWKSGMVYSPRTGKTYPAEIKLGKDGRLDIKVKDGMFSKHVIWTRQ